jgi:hypothetical protein
VKSAVKNLGPLFNLRGPNRSGVIALAIRDVDLVADFHLIPVSLVGLHFHPTQASDHLNLHDPLLVSRGSRVSAGPSRIPLHHVGIHGDLIFSQLASFFIPGRWLRRTCGCFAWSCGLVRPWSSDNLPGGDVFLREDHGLPTFFRTPGESQDQSHPGYESQSGPYAHSSKELEETLASRWIERRYWLSLTSSSENSPAF